MSGYSPGLGAVNAVLSTSSMGCLNCDAYGDLLNLLLLLLRRSKSASKRGIFVSLSMAWYFIGFILLLYNDKEYST